MIGHRSTSVDNSPITITVHIHVYPAAEPLGAKIARGYLMDDR